MIRAGNILFGAALAAATVLGAITSTASAAPLGAMQNGVTEQSPVQDVNYRGGRHHCHWSDGRKWCHGMSYRGNGPRYGYYNRYQRSPGITLRFGSDDRRYRDRRWR